MAVWPSATRQIQGKSKLEVQSRCDYPSLTGGAVNSVSLYQRGGRLFWTEITGDRGRKLRSQGSRFQIFPPTCSYRHPPPIRSIVQRAEASDNFLRKVYPDVDVSAGLIRDQITLDAQVLRDRHFFDSAMGNTLETIHSDDGHRKRTAFLAFPMGECSSELNISPFIYPKDNAPIFKPVAKPIMSFATPILQVAAPKFGLSVRREDHIFAVRTMGVTSLLSIRSNTDTESSYSPQIAQMSQILPSDIGGRPMVDVQLPYSSPDNVVLALNDQGSVYRWSTGQGSKTVYPVYVNPDSLVRDKAEQFCKLAINDHPSTCYIVLSDLVRQLDLRTRTCISDLWTINTRDALVTCAEMPEADSLTRVVTTKEVLWLDARYPGKPVLGIKHGRQFDRTLDIRTIEISSTPQSFLTSKRTGLISVYDVSRAPDNLVHVNVPPYCLPLVAPCRDTQLAGHTLFQHPHMRDWDIKIFQLSSQGSIYSLDATLSDESESGDPLRGEEQFFQWNNAVKNLYANATGLSADLGPLAERDHSEVSLQAAYSYCFMPEQETEETDAVYDVIEKMPCFWQDPDVQTDHILTTFDVAFRSGEEPAGASRADFLTQSAINGKRGFRALVQGRLDLQSISNNVPWHQNITSILQPFIPDISDDIQALVDRLKSYSLSDEDDRAPESLKREADACEQLALDLRLSTHVYSGKTFSTSHEESLEKALDDISFSTSALSLNGDPPPAHFGFLSPVLKSAIDHYPHSDQGSQSHQHEEFTPLGVRLLLNEWSVGMDPKNYIYKDPYKDEHSYANLVAAKSAGVPNYKTQKLRTPALPQMQKPPLVVKAAPPPMVTNQQGRKTGDGIHRIMSGLDRGQINTDEPESSQRMMVSTKIITEPFGGRPVAKKRPGKKRIGGF